jgi:predicted phosphodiesterase
MEFCKHVIKVDSRNEWYNIIPIGDIHLGNEGCEIQALKNMVDWIKEKDNTYWIGMGDYIDAINYSDPRFDPKTVSTKYMASGNIDKCIQMQIADVVKILEPIKDKCLGLLRGNHEESIRKYYHFDVLYEMAKDLNFNRNLLLYDTAIIRLVFKRLEKAVNMYDIYVSHGSIGGRTYGAKSNRLGELLSEHEADIYLLAHSHIKLAQMRTKHYFNRSGKYSKKKIVQAMTGCFLSGYSVGKTSYVEKMMFPPTDIGCVKIMLKPDTGDKHVSL